MLLFYIIFGNRNPLYHALGSNVPSARRPGQRFHVLQCRGSSPSLRFVNRHGGTLRSPGWVTFTKTYSRGKWPISHLPPTFAIIIHIPRPCIWRPHVLVRHVLTSHTWCPQVPRLASPSPHTRVPMSPSPCPRPTFIHSRTDVLVHVSFVYAMAQGRVCLSLGVCFTAVLFWGGGLHS